MEIQADYLIYFLLSLTVVGPLLGRFIVHAAFYLINQ